MCAFDLPTTAMRDALKQQAYEEGAIVLGCGERSVRFRPPLTITKEAIDDGIDRLRTAMQAVGHEHGASGSTRQPAASAKGK
jgi:L-lysine 6-transaminase